MVAKARTLAAHLLGTNEASLTFENGRFVGAPDDRSVTIQEVALAAYVRSIPPDFEPGLVATHFFEPKNFTFPNGTHVCVVEVDKETGDVKILRYVAVDDCGKQINPLIVQGQVHGGIAQGLAQALFEEVVYDENGQVLTGELMDYAVPKLINCPASNSITPKRLPQSTRSAPKASAKPARWFDAGRGQRSDRRPRPLRR